MQHKKLEKLFFHNADLQM